jgi:soluble lytic murein transglycosylase-like protein
MRDGYNICNPNTLAALDPKNCPPDTIPSPNGEGCSIDQSSKNFTANKNNVSAFDEAVVRASQQYGIPPERIRAIIIAESSGDPSETHQDIDGKSSYGLMQVRPDTARALDPNLKNLTDDQIAERLRDPSYNINLGTKYYAQLMEKYHDPSLSSAAYNGGPGANNPSKNCPGMRRWQCEWDDDAHTTPNQGYKVTRDYVTKTNAMEPLLK